MRAAPGGDVKAAGCSASFRASGEDPGVMPIPEMDDPSGGWYGTPNIRRPGDGLAKASKQIHKET
jgi:hypothetical protein